MSTQPSRTTIDLAPHTAPRPGLAMALALLAVPGSTVARELPWGGLWIGLPLALAAIVLGTHARREGAAKGLATAAIVVAGLCIAQMVVWTAAARASTTPVYYDSGGNVGAGPNPFAGGVGLLGDNTVVGPDLMPAANNPHANVAVGTTRWRAPTTPLAAPRSATG